MNILFVSQNVPTPTSGASTRNYHLLKTLAREHSVSVLALGEYPAREESSRVRSLTDLVDLVHVIAPTKPAPKRRRQLIDAMRGESYLVRLHWIPAMQQAINEACARERYDVVIFGSALMAGYQIPSGVIVIIDQHNIEYEILLRAARMETNVLRKWYYRLEGSRLKPIELERCRQANVVLVTSDRERKLLRMLLPSSSIYVVPNGVDIAAFVGDAATQVIPGRIIFTGAMDYYPNVQAVLSFAAGAWPLIRSRVPEATWYIVGRNPAPPVLRLDTLPGVTVTGAVPDIRPHVATAAVSIAPLVVGGGTRLKILEALAMGKAIVSTSQGCEGLAVVAGQHLEVADERAAFADAIVALLKDAGRRDALGRAGRSLVESTYGWDTCAEPLLRLLSRWRETQQRQPVEVAGRDGGSVND